MKLAPLNTIFEVTYGNKLDLNKMRSISSKDSSAIAFVSRTEKNNGVSAMVKKINEIEPYPPGLITVSLGGTKLLSSFVQHKHFYTAQNVAVLRPLRPMGINELLYYCMAIRHNRFRYGAFGREANRTLRTLSVPERASVPSWVHQSVIPDFEPYGLPLIQAPNENILNTMSWKPFALSELFEIKKGKRLTKNDMKPGKTVFIGSSDRNNGQTATIDKPPIHEGNTITVCYNGSVGEAFYQPEPFWASDDVNVLYPKFDLNPYLALFITTLIRKEKYRYNYGRKWHLGRMHETTLSLPVDASGKPDWQNMEYFIQSQPFASGISPNSKSKAIYNLHIQYK